MQRVYLAGPPFADEYRARAGELARAAGWEPVDPMRRDFRGSTEGHEAEIVEGDLADIDSCDAVLACFTAPDEGTAMEAWYAHSRGIPVVGYTGGSWAHPWTVYVARSLHVMLEDAVRAVGAPRFELGTSSPPGRSACSRPFTPVHRRSPKPLG